jgi:hypothetical protein
VVELRVNRGLKIERALDLAIKIGVGDPSPVVAEITTGVSGRSGRGVPERLQANPGLAIL